jgi:hypothetical protein
MKTKLTQLQVKILAEVLKLTDFDTSSFKYVNDYLAEKAGATTVSVVNAFRVYTINGIATRQGYININHPTVMKVLATLPKRVRDKKMYAEAVPDYRAQVVRRKETSCEK